jgi:type IV secretion system protein VirD4
MADLIGLLKQTAIGAVAGNCAVGLASLVLHPPDLVRTPLLVAASLAGGAAGYLRSKAQSRPSSLHGSAAFAAHRGARKAMGGEGLIVGRAEGGWLMRYAGPAHLLTLAPTRAGKGVGAVIPNLLTADRSVLCIDPKGENVRAAAHARRQYGKVHILDPFEVTQEPCAAYNPLAGLDPDDIDAGEDAGALANALVHDPPEQVTEAHWNEEARALLAGVILHAAASPYAARRNLAHVRAMITLPPDALALELRTMQASGAARGLVARAANRHLAKADREAAGVLSAAQRHTHFLDSPRMTKLMSASDFAFEELRSGHDTVFLVLPPDRFATHTRWLRLMVVQALSALARTPADPEAPPVLFLLDEFAALGRLEPVAQAFGLMAGYGVQLWPILQDLNQLKAAYSKSHGTFLSNAGVIQIFNVADIDTATWVSRTLGVTTETYVTTGGSASHTGGMHPSSSSSQSASLNYTRRDLLTPDEVMRIQPDHLLLLRPGEAPLFARKVRYYEEPEFRSLTDPGPHLRS